MKKSSKFSVFAAIALLSAGIVTTGCKSAPELTNTSAMALVQADYDKRAGEPATIAVDDMGLKQGLSAGLWKLTKVYPNQRWADYTLTDAGKKAVKLQKGGDVIEWRPDLGNKDFHFFVTTVASNKLKAKGIEDPHDDVIAGVDTAKAASFEEVYDWTGVPDAVQTIAHNAINRLSTKRQAEFALVGGAWTLHGIQ